MSDTPGPDWAAWEASKGDSGQAASSPALPTMAGTIGRLPGPAGTPAAPPTTGAGPDWTAWETGHGSGKAAPAPQQSAVAAPSKGGGGIGGFLGKIAHEAVGAVAALPEGVAHLGNDLGKSVINTARTGEAIVTGHEPAYLKVQPGEGFAHYVTRNFPTLSDAASPTINLGRHAAGVAQEVGAPGHGFADQLERDYGQNPLGSLLSDAAGAAIVLGPVAKLADVAGAGSIAEGTGAASGLSKAAAVAGKIAAAPAKPYEFALGKIAAVPAVAEQLDKMRANRQVRDFAAENYKQPARQVVGDVAQAFVPAGHLSADEQAALVMTQRNELGLVRPALDKMAPEQRAAFFEQHYGGHDSPVTPAAADIAYRLGNGTLPTEQAGRLDQAIASVRENVTGPRQAAALSGEGMAGGARLSPEQTGFAPLGDTTGENVKDWPARLRPMGIAAQDTIKTLRSMGGDHAALADEIRPTLAAIRAAGLDAEHVIGGSDRPGGAGTVRLAGGPPSEKPTGAQLQRLGNSTEYNAHGQAGMEAKRAVQGVRNAFAQKVADPASGFVVPSSAVTDDPVLSGRDLYQAAQMHPDHLVPYDPAKAQPLFPKGEGNVAPENVTRDTLFMPKNLYDAFAKQERAIPDYNSAGSRFDRLSTLVRKNPLLLSPTYHVRIATCNAMLAGLQGDLTANPLELAKRIGQARTMLSEGTAPRSLIRGGMFADEQALMDRRRAGTDQGLAGQAWHGPVKIGQKAAATIDNFSRVMAYIGEQAKGYTDEEAVRRANSAIGNYDQLSGIEQSVLRRVLPIYPWLKQVATVAGRLAQDHPVATTFALHMGNLAAQTDDQTGRPAWMRGWLPVGGNKFLPTDLVNPFGLVASPPGGFITPLAKAPLAALTGLNPSTMQQYSRPPGQPTHGALWHNPAELSYVLGGLNPLTRTLRDTQLRPVQRYGTGEPVVTRANGYREVTSQRPNPLTSLAGIPVPQAGPTAAQQAKTAKTAKTNDRTQQRYQQRVNKADRQPAVKQR